MLGTLHIPSGWPTPFIVGKPLVLADPILGLGCGPNIGMQKGVFILCIFALN